MKITMIDNCKYRVSLHEVDLLKYGKEYDLSEVDCKNLIGSGKAKLSSEFEEAKEETDKQKIIDDIFNELEEELIEEKPTIKPQVTKVVEPQVKKTRKYNKKNK